MKKITLLLSFVACAFLSQAQVLFIENFDYTVGVGLIGMGEWVNDGTSTTNPITVTQSTPLIYSGYTSSGIGNEVTLNNTGQDVSHLFTPQTSGTVYYSFLVNVSTAKSGDYFIHLVSSSAFFGQVFLKLDGSKIAFGIQNSSGGTPSPTYTTSIYDLGTTYLLVAKVETITGTSSLIVNPEISTVEPITGWITSSSPSNGGIGGTGVPTTSGISKINLRQGTATSAPTLKIDGIHVATTYNSAITSVIEPIINKTNIQLVGNKLNVTNVVDGTEVEIYSMLGAKVQSNRLIAGSIQLNDLAKGLYVVRVANASTKIKI